jgi:hypothetical protein
MAILEKASLQISVFASKNLKIALLRDENVFLSKIE